MRTLKTFARSLSYFLAVVLLPLTAWAQSELPHPGTYVPTPNDMIKIKRMFDDPRDLMETLSPKKILPPEIWNYLATDVKEAKKADCRSSRFQIS